jgi:hypothetical protein
VNFCNDFALLNFNIARSHLLKYWDEMVGVSFQPDCLAIGLFPAYYRVSPDYSSERII